MGLTSYGKKFFMSLLLFGTIEHYLISTGHIVGYYFGIATRYKVSNLSDTNCNLKIARLKEIKLAIGKGVATDTLGDLIEEKKASITFDEANKVILLSANFGPYDQDLTVSEIGVKVKIEYVQPQVGKQEQYQCIRVCDFGDYRNTLATNCLGYPVVETEEFYIITDNIQQIDLKAGDTLTLTYKITLENIVE